MNAPVDFLSHDEVDREPDQHPRCYPHLQRSIEQDDRKPVHNKDYSYRKWRGAKRDVFWLIGCAQGGMMQKMSFAQPAFRPMQNPAMISVLKTIGPNQPDQKTDEQPMRGKGANQD